MARLTYFDVGAIPDGGAWWVLADPTNFAISIGILAVIAGLASFVLWWTK